MKRLLIEYALYMTVMSLVLTLIGSMVGCAKRGPVGPQGAPGMPGQDSIIEIIKPCPDSSLEVILRMSNGDLLAHYSHGNRQYLTILLPGNYQLTDGSKCEFTVHPDLSVTW